MAFNPYLQTDLRDVLAQGANVGDTRTYNGQNFRWNGVSWEGGGGGSSMGMAGGLDWESMLNKVMEMSKKASEPAIATLQSSISPLKAQYQTLIDSIRGEKTGAVNQATVATGRELGKRGILPDSGVYSNEMNKATQEASIPYSKLEATTGMGQAQDITNINNAIAQLQAGGGMSGGINLFSTMANLGMNQQQLAATQAQQQAQNALAQQELALKEKQVNYEVGKPYTTASSGTGATDYNSIINSLLKVSTPTKTATTYSLFPVGAIGSKAGGGYLYR